MPINLTTNKQPLFSKIDYGAVPQTIQQTISGVGQTVSDFTNFRKSLGIFTDEEKQLAEQQARERLEQREKERIEKERKERLANLEANMQAAQQRFNEEGLWNSEDVYDVYNVYETDPVKQEEFRRNGETTAGVLSTIATLPFTAGMMGWVPAITTTATGAVGGYAGAYGGQQLGQYLDNKYGTNTTPWLSTIGGLAGGILGGGLGYRGTVQLGSRGWLPKGGRTMYGKQFVGDVAANKLNTLIKTVPEKKFNFLMDLNRSDEFVQQKLFQDPLDVKTIIHGDGAASGFNDPKKLTTVGHRELTSLKQLPHFERGRIVPANTEISQPGGRVISVKEHPLFLSDTQPWYETAHNGETLKRYWGIDGENSTGLWEWIDKKGKMHIPTESPYRFITANIDDLPDIKVGQFTGRRGSAEYELRGGIPIEKIKQVYEYDPIIKTWSRVQYVDPSKTSSKGSYVLFERPSKLTEAERMGIPKGDRGNLTVDQLEEVTINKAFKSGQLKYGQPTAYTAYHQSATPIAKFKFPFKRWDVKKHGADPNGAFFTVGEPAAAGFLAERPYTGQFQVKVQKPLIQTGELTGPTKNGLRNAIVRRARRDGADAVFFDGIADNTLQNQQILFAMDNADIGYRGMVGTPFKQGNWQLSRGMRNQPYAGEFVVSPKEGLIRRLNTVKDRQNFIRENPVSSYYGYGERHVPEGPWGGGGFVRTMDDEIYDAGERLIKYQHQLDDVIGDIQYNATLPPGDVGRTERVGIGYVMRKRPVADIKVSHAPNSDKAIDAITDLHELHHATGNTDDRFIYNYLKDNDIINWDNVGPYFKNAEKGEIGAHLSELPDYLGFTKGPGNRYQTAYGKRVINEEDIKNFIRFQKRNGFNQQHTIWGNIKNMPAFLDFMNKHKFAITAPILGGTAISGLTSQQQNIQ